MGGKTYSDDQRKMVSRLAGYGLTLPQISDCVDIAHRTLTRRFGNELRKGRALANGRVAQTLYAMATGGDNTAATIFWAKTRLGMSETNRVELTGPDGAPIATTNAAGQMLVPVVDAGTWTATVAQHQAELAAKYQTQVIIATAARGINA